MLQHFGIGHNGACEIGQVTLGKEGQREFPQLLRKGDPPCCRLFVGRFVRRVVLPDACDNNEHKANCDTADIESRSALQIHAGSKVSRKEIQ